MNNQYVKRKVVTRDMQSCLICQRLTDTVLFNKSGPDWIYTCDLHLDDNPQFVTPLYSEEYKHALEDMKRCQMELAQCKNKERHTGSWDGWITTIFNKKRENEKKEQDSESKPTFDETEKSIDSFHLERELQMKYDKALDTMTSLQAQNKNYKLSDKMFQYRMFHRKEQQQRLQQRKRQEEQVKKESESYTDTDPADLAEKFNFPSAPNSDLK